MEGSRFNNCIEVESAELHVRLIAALSHLVETRSTALNTTE